MSTSHGTAPDLSPDLSPDLRVEPAPAASAGWSGLGGRQVAFPRAGGLSRGYDRRQVDAFVARAEAALGEVGGAGPLTAAAVRRAGFDLVRRGYDVRAVDDYLDELEERALAREQGGAPAAVPSPAQQGRRGSTGAPASEAVQVERAAQELAQRISRGTGDVFPRAAWYSRGYRPSDVDAFLEVLAPVLRGESDAVEVDDVRRSVFRARRGGYAEIPVDDALDEAVDVLLRRRASRRPVDPVD